MEQDKQNTSQQWFSRKKLVFWSSVVVIAIAAYFANRAVQSHFGQQALEQTGLEILSLDQALEKAKTPSRLVLADMSAIWCPTCRKLDKQVLSNDKVKELINRYFVFARIEYESAEGKAFMKKHSIMGFPNILVLNTDGDKLVHFPFTLDADKFAEMLKQSAREHNYAIGDYYTQP